MIETIRLFLRPFTAQDLCFSSAFMQPEFMVFSPQGHHSERGAKNRILELSESYKKNGFGKLAAIEKDTGRIIGYCGLEPCVLDGKPEIELGFRLLTQFRGRGFATEAASALIEFEASRNIQEIVAFTYAENYESINVLSKLGFINSGQSVYDGMPVNVYRKLM